MNLPASLDAIVIAAFLAFCRIGACFMLMPGLSSIRVPMQIRLFTAAAVTFALLAHLWDFLVPFVSSRPDALLLEGNARFLERFSPERRAYLDLKLCVAASRRVAFLSTRASARRRRGGRTSRRR